MKNKNKYAMQIEDKRRKEMYIYQYKINDKKKYSIANKIEEQKRKLNWQIQKIILQRKKLNI
jgi:hypothetical protein